MFQKVPSLSQINAEVLENKEKRILKITLNRPKKLNAFSNDLGIEVMKALNYANGNDNILVVVLTGNGRCFSAGSDLTEKLGIKEIKDLVISFVRLKKILITLVNGPAIGIGCTILALSDFVYASEESYFSTPFTSLGLCPEAASSALFPQILGKTGNEMLIEGKKLSPQDALQKGLITKLFPNVQSLLKAGEELSELIASKPPNSLLSTKYLIRPLKKQKELEEVVDEEMGILEKRLSDPETLTAIMQFLKNKKSKL